MRDNQKNQTWQDFSVIGRIVRTARTVAVVGLSDNPLRPSHEVASYLRRNGLRILPVNPTLTSWEGLPAFPSLDAIPEHVDVVDVFRRAEHAAAVAEQAVAIGAGALWLQLGVVDPRAAELAEAGGLDVVMDRCLAVEHRNLRRGL